MKNALIIGRSTAQFPYIESVCDAYVKRGFKVNLAYDKYWSEKAPHQPDGLVEWLHNNQNASLLWYPKRPQNRLSNILFFCREFRSFSNYCKRDGDYEFYRNRWLDYLKLGPVTKKIFSAKPIQKIIASSLFDFFFRGIEHAYPTVNQIDQWLKEIKPDVVLISPMNLRFSGEVDIVKSLLKLNIPYSVLTLTWDNLSSKGIFQFKPQNLLVWNKAHLEDSSTLHGIPRPNVKIVGSPFFDKWRLGKITQEQLADHKKKLNIRFDQKIITYVGSSANIIKNETQIINSLRHELDNSENPELRKARLIVRFHPANWAQASDLQATNVTIYPKIGTLPSTHDEVLDFGLSILASDCVVGVNTSAMLDAVILDRPVFSLLVKKSVLRQTKSRHFQVMLTTGAIEVCKNVREIAKKSELTLENDQNKSNRKRFVQTYIWPANNDVTSGELSVVETIRHSQKKDRSS
jgi:hypothetical protein